jgi:hypothetical protein
MKRIRQAHDIKRCSANTLRSAGRRIRVLCFCGQTFYGPDRATALDTYAGHLLDARALDVFNLMGEQDS